MKKRSGPRIKRAASALLTLLLCCALCLSASASTPYRTYTVNGYGQVQETQTAYRAGSTLVKFGGESLESPNDIFVAADGLLYIADTGNARVVIGTPRGELVGTLGEGVLRTPMGVCVPKNGHIYVADRDLNAVVEFDPAGEVLHTYGKPDNPLYGETLSFLPLKVAVNDAGILYVVCESNTNGIVEISPLEGGTFLGYFGTNYTSTDVRTIVMRAILTDAQRAKMAGNIPATPDNLCIDSRGLIYTVTRGDGNRTLKRLNIAGSNRIPSADETEAPAGVAAGNHDNVYVVDRQGFICEYSSDGDLIFIFGGQSDGTQRVGLSTMVTGIAVDASDHLYTVDADSGLVQVYEPTEFTDLLHEALALYSVGRYTESKAPLEKVLRMNSLFDLANRAMGRACFQEEDYDSALRYARLAKDRSGWSDAFWEVRNAWLKKNLATALIVIAALAILFAILKALDRKHHFTAGPKRALSRLGENRFLSNLAYGFRYMRHPIDCSYGIAREGRANWAAPCTILGVFTLEYLCEKYLCGFLQKTVQDGRYEFLTDVGAILLIVFAATVCNYLVCSINDGEGTLKGIFTYICYSLTPCVVFLPCCFLLSHVLTRNEQFLITLLQVLMVSWSAVILVIGIREVNNYTAKETVKIILLTLFTVLILALIIFILYILWAQVFEFVSAIFGEVSYRVS